MAVSIKSCPWCGYDSPILSWTICSEEGWGAYRRYLINCGKCNREMRCTDTIPDRLIGDWNALPRELTGEQIKRGVNAALGFMYRAPEQLAGMTHDEVLIKAFRREVYGEHGGD